MFTLLALAFILAFPSPVLCQASGPGGFQVQREDEASRQPVPDASAQRLAEASLKEIFKDEYAKSAPSDRQALAKKLIKFGSEEKSAGAEKFTCFGEAAGIAAKAGDLKLALESLEALEKAYRIDSLEVRSRILEMAKTAVRSPEGNRALAREYLNLTAMALASDRYELSVSFAGAAAMVADKSKDAPSISEARAREREVQTIKTEYEKLEKERKTLEEDPAHPEANLAWGKFLCLIKEDWENGISRLARGTNAPLSAAAGKERALPEKPEDQIELGDCWWEMAKGDARFWKTLYLKRAVYWYKKAWPGIEGLVRARIEKRLLEYADLIPPRPGAIKVYLADMEEKEAYVGWGKFGKKGELGFRPGNSSRIRVHGQESPNGLSTHPPSDGSSHVIYGIQGLYRTLQADVALADYVSPNFPSRTPVVFRVHGDGILLWESKPVAKRQEIQSLKVRVAGVQTLKLEVHCPGNYRDAGAVWLEPVLIP